MLTALSFAPRAHSSTADVTFRSYPDCDQRWILTRNQPYYSRAHATHTNWSDPTKTIQQFIDEMSARQSAEIEQFKQAALERQAAAQLRRSSMSRLHRVRCKQRSAHKTKRAVAL